MIFRDENYNSFSQRSPPDQQEEAINLVVRETIQDGVQDGGGGDNRKCCSSSWSARRRMLTTSAYQCRACAASFGGQLELRAHVERRHHNVAVSRLDEVGSRDRVALPISDELSVTSSAAVELE